MVPEERAGGKRDALRRELLRRYVRLQRELTEADPASSSYQSTIYAFRQMGHALIASGFEEDLDRLLRIRILDGGRADPADRSQRSAAPDLLIMERRLL